jgi:protease-4
VRAKQIGLVDELGSLQDAIKFAAKSANLKTYNVSSYPSKVSKFEQIFSSETEEDFSTRLIKISLEKKISKFSSISQTLIPNLLW